MNGEMREWQWTARRIAGEWLSAMGARTPPVNPYEIAAWQRIPVVWGPLDPDRLAAMIDGRLIICNSRAGCEEAIWRRRMRYAVCHELMEWRLPEISSELGPAAEPVYQACASELLLYRPWLADLAAELSWDLPAIAERMDASAEATARALCDVEDVVVTVCDNLQTRRYGAPGMRFPREAMGAERAAIAAAYDEWREAEEEDDILRVRAWPIEPRTAGVRRVVAVTWVREVA